MKVVGIDSVDLNSFLDISLFWLQEFLRQHPASSFSLSKNRAES